MVLRKKLLIGDCSMDNVAQLLGMHRRTLDRRLQQHAVRYGELLESVQADLARQLLRRHDDAGTAGRRGTAILERRQFRHRIPALDGRNPR